MPRVVYNIPKNAKEEVLLAMRSEKNTVVKERLLCVLMFIEGRQKGEISKLMHRGQAYVGRWVTAYFNNGVSALCENRGGDNRSYLTQEDMQQLKHMITTSCPVYLKGWNGHSIVDLIEHHFKVKYTREAVYNILKRLNITHKIATKIDPKKSEIKIATWKEDVKKAS